MYFSLCKQINAHETRIHKGILSIIRVDNKMMSNGHGILPKGDHQQLYND